MPAAPRCRLRCRAHHVTWLSPRVGRCSTAASWPRLRPRPSLQPSLLNPHSSTLTSNLNSYPDPDPNYAHPDPDPDSNPNPNAHPSQVEKLKHQSDLQEARNNPVEEELGGDDAYSEIDSLQAGRPRLTLLGPWTVTYP